MFAEWAERTSTAPISSQAARSAPSMTWSVTGSRPAQRSITTPSASERARQPGGTTSVEPGSSKIAGPVDLGLARAEHRRVEPLAAERAPRVPRRSARLGAAGRRLGARQRGGHADRHELELGVGVRVAVALLVGARRRRSRSSSGSGSSAPSIDSSKAWPA